MKPYFIGLAAALFLGAAVASFMSRWDMVAGYSCLAAMILTFTKYDN